MGLDITAYQNVNLVEVLLTYEDYEEKYDNEWEKYDYVHSCQDFPDRLPPLEVGGVYTFEKKFWFRAGSYSGYNSWREELAAMALSVTPREIWNNPDRFSGMPFVELINFSDCEGHLGSEVCKKLLKDFDTFVAKAEQIEVDYFFELYQNWHKAFRMAANNGYIDFH